MTTRVAVVQMVSGMDIQKNLETAGHWIEEAARQGAELVVLPENFAVFSVKQMVQSGIDEKDQDGPIRTFLSKTAKSLGIWIAGGTVPCITRPDGSDIQNRVRSVCRLYDSEGQEAARYDKIHLFDADVNDSQSTYRESNEIEHGGDVVVVDTPFGKIGIAVCYDLRFGELFIKMEKSGAEIIVLPAAFTKETGDAHWEPLVRARAIETQTWLLASNQGGQHTSKRATSGSSMIVDPWGKIVNRIYTGEGVILGEINMDHLKKCRSSIPVQQHRRL